MGPLTEQESINCKNTACVLVFCGCFFFSDRPFCFPLFLYLRPHIIKTLRLCIGRTVHKDNIATKNKFRFFFYQVKLMLQLYNEKWLYKYIIWGSFVRGTFSRLGTACVTMHKYQQFYNIFFHYYFLTLSQKLWCILQINTILHQKKK